MYVSRQRARLLPVPGTTGLKDFTPSPPRSGDFFAFFLWAGLFLQHAAALIDHSQSLTAWIPLCPLNETQNR